MKRGGFSFWVILLLGFWQVVQAQEITTKENLVAEDSTAAVAKTANSALSVPALINYQGYLADASGNPVTGSVAVSLSVWDAVTGGIQLWSEDQTIDVHFGYLNAELGKGNPFPTNLFDGHERYLQVSINDEMMTPRKRIVSVAHAMTSGNALTLNGNGIEKLYLRSQADDFSSNAIDAAKLGGHAAGDYMTKEQIESNFVPRGRVNSVTGEMIVDGSIQLQDIGFSLGLGDISGVSVDNGLDGGGSSGEIRIGLAPTYVTGQAYDGRFVRKGEASVVTGSMVKDDEITGADIKNGTISKTDLDFSVSSISQISPSTGLAGGGSSGTVFLSLNTDYQLGRPYDSRFINVDETNSITSTMIRDNEITGTDIKNGSVQPEDLSFPAGNISGVLTSNGIQGGGTSGTLHLQLEPAYQTGAAYDTRFVIQDQASSITSSMVVDNALRPEDFSFPVGDITDIQTRGGITGGGVSGDVVLRLEDTYASGDVFNVKFVNENQLNSITSPMITDGEVESADIAASAINGEHLANSFRVERDQANGAIVTVKNNSSFETSHGLEARGYYGVKGIGTYTGLYGEGTIYGVYAKASNPLNYGLYVEGRAFCTNGGWGDVAEFVDSDEKLESGDVVIIDPDGRNKVKKCTKPYDTRVAGVVSSDPTITVGRTAGAAGNYPLALTGIVPCKAIAQPAIQPGDLLTTSDVPGYAQKATEPEVGTILGKALEPLASGKGLINVLINTR